MNEQLNTALKQQLRDVHLPQDISWWPFAYGWWISMIILLAGITALAYYFLRKRKQNAYRRTALKELNTVYTQWQQQSDVAAYLQAANAILKRSVLHFTKQHDAASQSGQAWLDILASSAQDDLSVELKEALATQIYRANPLADIHLVHQEICDWLISHQAQPSSPKDGGVPASRFSNSKLKPAEFVTTEANDA